jgi:7-carboxy-7-deazaguanine synthase
VNANVNVNTDLSNAQLHLVPTETKRNRLPVIEIFGPTVQGEGIQTGVRTLFVRFGYCDYRCSWCDSMVAVLPELVKANATWMEPAAIATELIALGRRTATKWVTVSGGNPALHLMIGTIVQMLHSAGIKVAVETQGSLWQPWLSDCDVVVISPKPPSSGMTPNLDQLHTILARLFDAGMNATFVGNPAHVVILKVVVFDEDDYLFARAIHKMAPVIPFYISVGNPDTHPHELGTPEDIAHKYALLQRLRTLMEWTLADNAMADVIVGPQLHVLAWGNIKGV